MNLEFRNKDSTKGSSGGIEFHRVHETEPRQRQTADVSGRNLSDILKAMREATFSQRAELSQPEMAQITKLEETYANSKSPVKFAKAIGELNKSADASKVLSVFQAGLAAAGVDSRVTSDAHGHGLEVFQGFQGSNPRFMMSFDSQGLYRHPYQAVTAVWNQYSYAPPAESPSRARQFQFSLSNDRAPGLSTAMRPTINVARPTMHNIPTESSFWSSLHRQSANFVRTRQSA